MNDVAFVYRSTDASTSLYFHYSCFFFLFNWGLTN